MQKISKNNITSVTFTLENGSRDSDYIIFGLNQDFGVFGIGDSFWVGKAEEGKPQMQVSESQWSDIEYGAEDEEEEDVYDILEDDAISVVSEVIKTIGM